jgi:hypothetical protein
MTTDEILDALADERERQAFKWSRMHEWGYGDCSGFLLSERLEVISGASTGEQYSNLTKAAVLAEEAGEVVKAALNVDEANFRTEVIQTLAVAWAILEGIDS